MDRPNCYICGKPSEKNGKYWRKVCTVCRTKAKKHRYPRNLGARWALRYGMNLEICSKCGWVGLCDAHHKGRNRANNTKDNLEVLCPNCHRTIHQPLKHLYPPAGAGVNN